MFYRLRTASSKSLVNHHLKGRWLGLGRWPNKEKTFIWSKEGPGSRIAWGNNDFIASTIWQRVDLIVTYSINIIVFVFGGWILIQFSTHRLFEEKDKFHQNDHKYILIADVPSVRGRINDYFLCITLTYVLWIWYFAWLLICLNNYVFPFVMLTN